MESPMHLKAIAGIALFSILSSTALAAPPADCGWYLAAPSQSKATTPLAHIGTGFTPGIKGSEAVYFKNDRPANLDSAYALERKISLASFQGKRVRLSVRLRNDGEYRAWTNIYIPLSAQNGIGSFRQQTAFGKNDWETHEFVFDVPDQATDLMIAVTATNKGTIWVDDLSLAPVDKNVRTTEMRRVINSAPEGCTKHYPSRNVNVDWVNCKAVGSW
jgi:hypothetical protein